MKDKRIEAKIAGQNPKRNLKGQMFMEELEKNRAENIKTVEEKSKNIGIILPSGKKVKLTNFPFRTETVYLETRNKFPLTVWQELNELHAQYISQLATYKLEEVRNFIQSKGKGKLIAYRKEEVSQEKTKEDAREC